MHLAQFFSTVDYLGHRAVLVHSWIFRDAKREHKVCLQMVVNLYWFTQVFYKVTYVGQKTDAAFP